MMTYVLIWYAVGFFTAVIVEWLCYLNGDPIIVGDIVPIIIASALGPLLIIISLYFILDTYKDKILFQKKPKEK